MTCQTALTDQASAIRWLIENRRPEILLPEAIRRLRIALHGNTSALATLDTLERDSATNG